jgi:hypothetical protein
MSETKVPHIKRQWYKSALFIILTPARVKVQRVAHTARHVSETKNASYKETAARDSAQVIILKPARVKV